MNHTAAHGLVKGPKKKKQLHTEKNNDNTIYPVMLQWAMHRHHQDRVQFKGPPQQNGLSVIKLGEQLTVTFIID